MKRISVRRVASVIVTAMAMTLVFATLGWAMMPQWNTRPYTKHIVIASADTTITPAHANIPHEGRYRTRETRLSIKTGASPRHRRRRPWRGHARYGYHAEIAEESVPVPSRGRTIRHRRDPYRPRR